MGRRKLILVDLDGTLLRTKSGAICPQRPKDQELIYDMVDFLGSQNATVYGISNQGGCEAINPETGKPYKTLRQAIAEMRYLLKACPLLDRVYFCPNMDKKGNDVVLIERPWWMPFFTVQQESYDDGAKHPQFITMHPFRKPNPGMLELALNHYNQKEVYEAKQWGVTLKADELLQPSEVLFIGDMESDRQAAEAFGCEYMPAENVGGNLVQVGVK